MLGVIVFEWHHVGYHYAECHYVEFCKAKHCYTVCHYAECHGTTGTVFMITKLIPL
jgi:hypothetical protein